MSVEERVEAIEKLSDFLQENSLALSALDTSAVPTSEMFVKTAVDASEEAFMKWVPKLIALMSKSLDHEEALLKTDSTNDQHEEAGATIAIQHQRRTKQKRNNQDDHEDQREEEQHRRTNHQSRNHNFGRKFDSIFRNQAAVMNGDERHLNKLFSSLKATHERHAGGSSTSSGETHGRKMSPWEDKNEQCYRLAECAYSMSQYDQLVYYFSDDIDPKTGEIDDNIYRFDELDLISKFFKTQKLAWFILWKEEQKQFDRNAPLRGSNNWGNIGQFCQNDLTGEVKEVAGRPRLYQDSTGQGNCDALNAISPILQTWVFGEMTLNLFDACDDLLQEFHRTVEFDGIPQWQGAFIDQVCLAEGTTVYVDLFGIYSKLDPVLHGPYYNSGRDNSLADLITEEMFTCAKDLFEFMKSKTTTELFTRHETEEFVFLTPGSYEFVRIPTGIDLEAVNRDAHGQLLNNQVPGFTFANLGLVNSFLWDSSFGLSSIDGGVASLREPYYCPYLACRAKTSKSTAAETEVLATAIGCDSHWESGIDHCLCEADDDDCYKEDADEMDKVNKACTKNCGIERKKDYYNTITKGFELVFGDKPSVGFICGIKEAVVNKGKKLPGECCLDAPYQLDYSNWGNKVSLELERDSKRACYDD
jgi:hypothetical protein